MLVRLLRERLAPYGRPLAAVVAFQFVGVVAMLYLPSLNADIIDEGIATGDTGRIWELGGAMLAISFVQIVCSVLAVRLGSRTAMALGRDIRAALFHRVGTFSTREVQEFGAPSLITRTTNDVQQVQMLVLMSCTMAVAAPIMMVGGVLMALRVDAGLGWTLLLVVPALFLAVGLVVSRMIPDSRRMQPKVDEVNRVLREQITGIRVVRAFVRERHEIARFHDANADLTDVALRVGRWMFTLFPLVMVVVNVSSVGVLWVGAHRVDEGLMEVGPLTAFLSYLMQILMSVMMATFMLMLIPRAAVCADRITEVLETETSVTPPASPQQPDPGRRGHLDVRAATFSYPGADEPVLAGVSFEARPGQTVAVVGSTGAGKSTLVNLVPRLFDVTDGSVSVGGVDVRDLEPEVLWAELGLVPQRAYLFSGTRPQQPGVRAGRRHRRPALGGARDRPGARLRRGAGGRARRVGRAGRHQLLGRPAAAARDRPGAGTSTRRSTCSTTASRRSTWRPTRGSARRCGPTRPSRRWSSSRSGSPRSGTPTRSSWSRTAGSSAAVATASCSTPVRRTARSSSRS